MTINTYEFQKFETKVQVIKNVKIEPNMPLKKPWSVKYQEWVHIFHLGLWAKKYGQKKVKNQIDNLIIDH